MRTMTLDEFEEHYEDWKNDPWWDSRYVVGALAHLCAMFVNVHRKEGTKEFTAEDFMPRMRTREEPVEEVSPGFADVMQFMRDIGNAGN